MTKKNNSQYLGVDYFYEENISNNPYCAHGPTLKFIKYIKNKKPRRFYACSAYRSKGNCSFFHWEDRQICKKKVSSYLNEYKRNSIKINWKAHKKRNNIFTGYSNDNMRRICLNCRQLLIIEEWLDHSTHELKSCITPQSLLHPTNLFHPIRDSSTLAQEYFSQDTLKYLNGTLNIFSISKVLCIGSPSLHESVSSQSQFKVTSFLLDLDIKYSQFFSPKKFQRYNLFNNHFFSKSGYKNLLNFINNTPFESILIVLDPPFGVKLELVYHSLVKLWISMGWKRSILPSGIPTLWIFPYFNAKKISSLDEEIIFNMLHYKVGYENKYRKGSRGSPVRIFTNLSLCRFSQPQKETKFCTLCHHYVFNSAIHCNKCKKCISYDGNTYTHCSICDMCVKISFKHCLTCDACHLPLAYCSSQHKHNLKCHICHEEGHYRLNCPKMLIIL